MFPLLRALSEIETFQNCLLISGGLWHVLKSQFLKTRLPKTSFFPSALFALRASDRLAGTKDADKENRCDGPGLKAQCS